MSTALADSPVAAPPPPSLRPRPRRSASEIIRAFGGATALGRLLGKRQQAVSNWVVNGVPGSQQLRLLRLGRILAVDVIEEDFMSDADLATEAAALNRARRKNV